MGDLEILFIIIINSKSSATRSYQYVQYFRVPKQCYSCQCLGFLRCWCTRTRLHKGGVRTPWKRVCTDIWLSEKNPLRALGNRTRVNINCAWPFGSTFHQLSCPANRNLSKIWFLFATLLKADWEEEKGMNTITAVFQSIYYTLLTKKTNKKLLKAVKIRPWVLTFCVWQFLSLTS